MSFSKDFSRKKSYYRITLFILAFSIIFFGLYDQEVLAKKPTTVAEIALYQGPDREKILIEGAKNEKEIVFYTVDTWLNSAVTSAFEKKYPFIKVRGWRNRSTKLLKRVYEEYAAKRYIVDVVSTSPPTLLMLHRVHRIYQEYYSPDEQFYPDEVKVMGKKGVYYIVDRENYISLGFNTNLIPPEEAPKTFDDLLDPKWKGKMSIPGSSTGVWVVGNMDLNMGRDFLRKLSEQQIQVQNISGAALAQLVSSGEVPLSPAIYNTNVFTGKKKGAPIEWRAIGPAVVNACSSGITTHAPHPFSAMLFLDFMHSKEGQTVVKQGGQTSGRKDIKIAGMDFKKTYMENKFQSLDQYNQKFNEWQKLLKDLFIKGR